MGDLQDEFRDKGPWSSGEVSPEACKSIAKRVSMEFAEWCTLTQAFGLYGYDHAYDLFIKEKGY